MALKPLWRLIAGFIWFQVQRICVGILESVVLFLNGTRKKIRENNDIYARSARISSVHKWILFDPWAAYNSTWNLITWHEGFVHPEYVLKDEVSLYCMTDEEAWFMEAPEGVEVWKSEYSAFHKIAQHEYAKNVIKMPLRSFYLLADKISDIKQKLIFLDFVPRSGSTLVGQIFEETGVCVNYSEPHFLNMYWGAQNHQKLLKITKAAIKFYCKPRKQLTSAFVFKCAPMGVSLAPVIFELFPDAKLLHLTRNAIPNAISIFRVNQVVTTARLLSSFLKIPYIGRIVNRKILASMNLPLDDFTGKLFDESEDPDMLIGCYLHTRVQGIYMTKHRNAEYRMPVIKYEDVLSNREANIETLFQFCGLDVNLVHKAMAAFDKDSQAGSPLSKDQLEKNTSAPNMANIEAIVNDVRKLGEHFGLGDVSGDFRLPGTITIG
ncbi:hypothetical protein CAPTEDRAFT_199451 [Capitella teleta]|uniref:Sulfotransferase domain-containing protein n=1 Tax=Capitella teleta TaxID=283909 RepID=R7V949_CAPTE|nr:hypothetical protein CAPTEDRAFT_199451 [Capitella teleta]|eukprot:ELU15373.1 hypothetical protein CAPTEDRAFT_199451 [Capitella teleta]